ncbi:MAG: GT2 family glycosyltransferase [Bacteroidia bacterium]
MYVCNNNPQHLKLSVIIVNYNVRYFLEQCLISVEKASKNLDVEVFVVDNDSVDGSVQMVREKFPEVTCIANKKNVGFSAANNQAIRVAKGEYVLLLNPDTVVQEDTFSKCITYMGGNQKVGGLGVKMIDGKGTFLPESKRGLPTPEVALYKMAGLNKLFPKSKRFGKYHLSYLSNDQTAPIEVLAGAFMFIRSCVLEEVGLLDEDFFMYGEDIDLSYRIILGGYQNVYFPETSIIHYKGESTKKMSVNYVFVFYRAMVLFAKKHYHGNNASMLVFLIKTAIYVRAFLAVGQRFMSRIWLFTVDAALLTAGLFLIKNYWEEHIRDFTSFPEELVQIHFPYYIFLWLSAVYLSGGYQKPPSAKRILRGIFIGTVLISAVYGLLPNHLRYSRGIILAGTFWAAFSMVGLRLLLHFKKFKNFNLGSKSAQRTIILGHSAERERVLNLIQKSETPVNFLGFVSLEDEKTSEVLGPIDRLVELCKIYKVDEIIFCSKDVTSAQTMHWMTLIGSTHTTFKIVPDERFFIIGSNSKDLNGELYTEEISFALSDEYIIRKKRLFDVGVSLCLLPIGILVGWFGDGIGAFFKRTLSVLMGKKSWVGYCTEVNSEHLPKLKFGIFSTDQENDIDVVDAGIKEKLNYFYAKNYSIDTDLNILINNVLRKTKGS